MGLGRPPMPKMASNSKMQVASAQGNRDHLRKNSDNVSRLNETEWGEVPDGNHSQMHLGQGNLNVTSRGEAMKQRSDLNLTTSRLNGQPVDQKQLRQRQMNNLMNNSDQLEEEKQMNSPNDRDRRLSNIANSVNGFYREPNMSEHSVMRSTHESNFAQNMLPLSKKGKRERQGNNGAKMNSMVPVDREKYNDPELERIYGTARGLADMTVLSDWEKDSEKSGRSQQSSRSQF